MTIRLTRVDAFASVGMVSVVCVPSLKPLC